MFCNCLQSYRRLSEIRTVDDVTKFLKENNFGEYAKVFKGELVLPSFIAFSFIINEDIINFKSQ